MKKLCLFISAAIALCLTACGTAGNNGTSENTISTSQMESAINENQEESQPQTTDALETTDTFETTDAFELTDSGKAFLEQMCRELSDFDAQTTMDETFWKDFLFCSYTGISPEEAEMTQIYREDLGFDETVVKVSQQEAQAHARLIFGIELPDIRPTFESMEEGQTSCYYEDGYYYIGVSDFPDYQYTFAESEKLSDSIIVKYSVDFEGESNVGTVSFTISPEDNENGFIIRSKSTELFQ